MGIPNPIHLKKQVRRATVLTTPFRFLWREVVLRKPGLARYVLRETGQVVFLRHRSSDLGGLTEVVVEGTYGSERARRIFAALPPNPVVVDLGANIGLFALRAAALRPDASIVAFEPDPANARVLRETARANQAQWKIIEACASTADGSVLFEAGNFMGSAVGPKGAPTPAKDVLPVMVDADVVKIDIEGAEMAILEDPRFARSKAALLFLEYHPPHPGSAVTSLLENAGYQIDPFEERIVGVADLTAWKP